jgi:hypothetical protein
MKSVEEMIAVLQVYIHIRKDKEVSIKPTIGFRQMALLIKAYDYAVMWMKENDCKIYAY